MTGVDVGIAGEDVGSMGADVGLAGAGVGATGAADGSTRAGVGPTGDSVGPTGADVGSTGADDGTTGVKVGSTGADVGSTGATVASTGAGVTLTGAAVGATGVGPTPSTRTASESVTRIPESAPTAITVALMGPSGASNPNLIGPVKYLTSPGHKSPPLIIRSDARPPMGAGSLNTALVKHSRFENGTVTR